jgi:hypothetical protein
MSSSLRMCVETLAKRVPLAGGIARGAGRHHWIARSAERLTQSRYRRPWQKGICARVTVIAGLARGGAAGGVEGGGGGQAVGLGRPQPLDSFTLGSARLQACRQRAVLFLTNFLYHTAYIDISPRVWRGVSWKRFASCRCRAHLGTMRVYSLCGRRAILWRPESCPP